MRELLEPIFFLAFTICTIGLALLMPMIVYAAYKGLIKGDSK